MVNFDDDIRERVSEAMGELDKETNDYIINFVTELILSGDLFILMTTPKMVFAHEYDLDKKKNHNVNINQGIMVGYKPYIGVQNLKEENSNLRHEIGLLKERIEELYIDTR